MKIETNLRKILDKDFFPTLKKIMGKWPEAKDIHALVKIAESIEAEARDFQKTQEAWEMANGFILPDGTKSVRADKITDRLLQEYGRFDANSNLTINGAAEEDKEDFLKKKSEADSVLIAFDKEMNDLLSKPFELEIPRQIKVDPKNIRKEHITAQDCFVLLPILDLSLVSDLGPSAPSEDDSL